MNAVIMLTSIPEPESFYDLQYIIIITMMIITIIIVIIIFIIILRRAVCLVFFFMIKYKILPLAVCMNFFPSASLETFLSNHVTN